MAAVRPFRCIRPEAKKASAMAALPYDVYSRREAKEEVEREPLSFLRIDRAETQFPDSVDTYAPQVYEKARDMIQEMLRKKLYIQEEAPCYYLYELTMEGHVQTGIVACSSVDDYLGHVVKKHENTRAEKEEDRIRHVDVTNTHTGPIFLAYREKKELRDCMETVKREAEARPEIGSRPAALTAFADDTGLRQNGLLYDFVSPDQVRHRVFKIGEPKMVDRISRLFSELPCTYIADGHHRAASAVKVALKRRQEQPGYTGEEGFNWFLSVLFPDRDLQILPYNRAVKDLNGWTEEAFLEKVAEKFVVQKAEEAVCPGEKGTFGLLLKQGWYTLKAKPEICSQDPVQGLDVSILQDQLLGPVLGIGDSRTDERIDFIGGIRGLSELEKRVGTDMAAAISMYPTSMEELLSVADAGLLMPPKSTWFEPKLRSGIFLHRL